MTTQRAPALAIAAFNDCRRVAVSQLASEQNAELHEANDELHRLLDATKRGECIIPIRDISKGRTLDVTPSVAPSVAYDKDNCFKGPGLLTDSASVHLEATQTSNVQTSNGRGKQ